jgi:hypothetical protein
MTQDNIYAYAQFSVIAGRDVSVMDYEGEDLCTLRLFPGHEAAIDYARDLCNDGYDYAYVMGVGPDGVPDTKRVVRVADDAPDFVNLG